MGDPHVLIVGAGPVGALLAIELAARGVRTTVLERTLTPPTFPKMDFINGRSMELLRRNGLAGQVRAGGVNADAASDFVWTTGLDRPPVARWTYPSPADLTAHAEATTDGSAPLEVYQRIQGNRLEELLRRAAAEHPLVELLAGWSFSGLYQTSTEVVVSSVSADATQHTLRADYVVGCDGAGSAVRRWLDIPVTVTGPTGSRCSVFFRSADPVLRRHGRAFVTIAAAGLTLVSRDDGDLWTGSFPVPADEPFTGDPIATMQRKLGVGFTVDEVLSVGQWQGTLAVADTYRRGRVFIAGDAAHQFYPFGGHGANTGIGDAVNLGWKLAGVLHGWAGDDLLASYQAERRPVARFNREMCGDLLEVARRFGRLAEDGASAEHLAGYLRNERHQVANVGVHFGDRYDSSPVVVTETGPAPAWSWDRINPTTWPGARPPAMRLADGSALFDHLGPGFTLLDMSATGEAELLVKHATGRGVPMRGLVVAQPDVRAAWECDLVLVRPDQHVAWRGDHAPADWDAVLDRVSGRGAGR